MDIRDVSLLDRSQSWLTELLEFTKKGGRSCGKCPNLSADVHRKANALKDSLERLRKALDEAGPPPVFLKERQPLYLRINEHGELCEIARLLRYDGCLEDTLFDLARDLSKRFPPNRVSDAIKELVWIKRETRWAMLRPEVLRSCRVLIGPPPDDPAYGLYWSDRGGPPTPRTPEGELEKRLQAAKEEAAREEPKAEEKPGKKRTRKKTA